MSEESAKQELNEMIRDRKKDSVKRSNEDILYVLKRNGCHKDVEEIKRGISGKGVAR